MKNLIALGLLCVALIGLSAPASARQNERPIARNYWIATPRWSPDNHKIAVPLDNFVEVRDTTTSELLFTLTGHTGSISSVAWSPDSRGIATSSYDQTVTVWNAIDGKPLHTLVGQNDIVGTVSWSPDDIRLVSTGFDVQPTLHIWDAQTGDVISMLDGGTIVEAAFSPDGGRVAVSASLAIGILDGSTFDVIAASPNVLCCPNQTYSLAWSPDGNKLVTGSMNGLVTIWDAATLDMLKQFPANTHYAPDSRDVDNLGLSWVRAVTFSADGSFVRAVSGDGTVNEWDALTGDILQTMQIDPIAAAAWSPDTDRLAVFSLATLEGLPMNYDPGDIISETSNLAGEMSIIAPFPAQ